MSKTNSNSITSILIYALNNKKSGFREAIIKRFKEKNITISDDIFFSNGTHTTLPLAEMAGTKIDILGIEKAHFKIMIEVKASLYESLQHSQKAGGSYEITAREKNIPLVYIIPDGYKHEDQLPKKKDTDRLFVEILYWSEIRDIAKKTDSTGLDYQIEKFVEFIDQESILNRNEIAFLLMPGLIAKTYKIIKKLLTLIEKNCPKHKKKQDDQYGIGYDWETSGYWIGLVPTIDERFFFSLAIAATKKPSFKNDNDVYYDGTYYYVPYDSNNAKEIGDKVEKDSISNLINSINNDFELKTWLNEPQKRIIEIKAIYSLSAKLQKLVKEFLLKSKINDIGDPQSNEDQIGYYFDNENKFLGISPNEESTNSFSLAIYKGEGDNNKKIYEFLPLSIEKEFFYKFLLSETKEEQQENFNELAKKVLESAKASTK